MSAKNRIWGGPSGTVAGSRLIGSRCLQSKFRARSCPSALKREFNSSRSVRFDPFLAKTSSDKCLQLSEIERLRYGSPWRDEDWELEKLDRQPMARSTAKSSQHPTLILRRPGRSASNPDRLHRLRRVKRSSAERLSDPFLSYSDEYRKLKENSPCRLRKPD